MFERPLAALRAKVVRLAIVGETGAAVVGPHPTDGVTVLSRRAQSPPVDVQQEPREGERDDVEVERVVEFEVRVIV